MSNKNEIWDPAKVEEFRELSELSGESVFGRLYEVYRDETPEQLIRLGVHMENEEWLQARELAHHMKGGAMTLGALKITQLTEILEFEATEEKKAYARKKYKNLQEQVKIALENLPIKNDD